MEAMNVYVCESCDKTTDKQFTLSDPEGMDWYMCVDCAAEIEGLTAYAPEVQR